MRTRISCVLVTGTEAGPLEVPSGCVRVAKQMRDIVSCLRVHLSVHPHWLPRNSLLSNLPFPLPGNWDSRQLLFFAYPFGAKVALTAIVCSWVSLPPTSVLIQSLLWEAGESLPQKGVQRRLRQAFSSPAQPSFLSLRAHLIFYPDARAPNCIQAM